MKKYVFIFLSLIIFASCSKDSKEDDIDISSKIEGTWYLHLTSYYELDPVTNERKPTPKEIKKPHGSYIWTLTKQGDDFQCKYEVVSHWTDYYVLYHESGNVYYTMDNLNNKVDRYIFKYVSDKELEVEHYDRYYYFFENEVSVFSYIR